MTTIGLLGGVASGKSTVARLLAEHGAVVLDADRIAHEVLAMPEVVQALAEQWGESVLSADGMPDRSAIAEKVFGDSPAAIENRRFLEQLVHPRVRQQIRGRLAELREQQRGGQKVTAAVLDVPLLLESGYRDDCDRLLFVDTPNDARTAHAEARGWAPYELAQREAAQKPLAEKRAAATDVILNDGALEALTTRVAEFWRNCQGSAGA